MSLRHYLSEVDRRRKMSLKRSVRPPVRAF